MHRRTVCLSLTLFCFLLAPVAMAGARGDISSWNWTEVNEESEWLPRAGLQVVDLHGKFYLMGGRTPRPPSFPPIPGDSDIWGDVWRSRNLGKSWRRILETNDEQHWPARAYFQAVKRWPFMYVIGGQNFRVEPNPDCPPPYIDCAPFLSQSDFFSDVWRSPNGIHWRRMTADAGFTGRAGLSAVAFRGALWVMGGSFNDDPAVIGGPPERVYFNDVWMSYNGRHWVQVTENAPWDARAGAIAVVKWPYLYLIGGEFGFLCEPQPCDPPYFNDVWRTRDGVNWELVTDDAPWLARPGHQVVVANRQLVLFGGFGLPANPMDVWTSRDGDDWTLASTSPWNAVSPTEIKYDFAAAVKRDRFPRKKVHDLHIGGDRETFDFGDSLNYLNVDNDVWRFEAPRGKESEVAQADAITPEGRNPADSVARLRTDLETGGVVFPDGFFEELPMDTSERTAVAAETRPIPDPGFGGEGGSEEGEMRSGPERTLLAAEGALPNPFSAGTTIAYELSRESMVSVDVYDTAGRRVRTLVSGIQTPGIQRVAWDGRDGANRTVAAGLYFVRIDTGSDSRMIRLVRLK